jgi:hypothetical protein
LVGSSPTRHSLGTLSLVLGTWGFHVAGQAGFKTGALMKSVEMKSQFNQKAKEIEWQFFQAILSGN